jgi:hypothetical protein
VSVRRTTLITIETEQVLIIRRRHAVRAWCQECGAEADFMPADQMGRVVNLSSGTRSRPHHVAHSEDGALLVCLDSWLKLP